MKKLSIAILTIVAAFSGINASAQGKYGADSAECIKYLSYYKEYFKQKNYDEALPNWREAYRLCPPTANQTMLVDGATLLRRVIQKNMKNEVYKNALVDSLMTLHDQRVATYPKYSVTALNAKGQDLYNFVKDDYKKLYEEYNAIIDANQEKTKASLFVFDLNAAINLYQNGQLGAEDVINTYQKNLALIQSAPAATETEAAAIEKEKTNLESLFIQSKVASCENLIALFTPRYEANPDDLALVSNIVNMMNATDDCSNNELYLKAVTSMHMLSPSYKSAYGLYKLNAARGNTADAVKYLEEAIESPDSDTMTDGEYSYELAAFCYKNNMRGKAIEAARKAMEKNPSMTGKCYFLMGTIWGSTSCGGDEIARRAPYWVAVDYLQKAKAADATLTDDANKLIGQYSVYFPETAEAFMYDLTDGKSYTISCSGMTATTTVRTRK